MYYNTYLKTVHIRYWCILIYIYTIVLHIFLMKRYSRSRYTDNSSSKYILLVNIISERLWIVIMNMLVLMGCSSVMLTCSWDESDVILYCYALLLNNLGINMFEEILVNYIMIIAYLNDMGKDRTTIWMSKFFVELLIGKNENYNPIHSCQIHLKQQVRMLSILECM
jgi:hypothetical protein